MPPMENGTRMSNERFDHEKERYRDVHEFDGERERDKNLGGQIPPPLPGRGYWDGHDRRVGFPPSPIPWRMEAEGRGQALPECAIDRPVSAVTGW